MPHQAKPVQNTPSDRSQVATILVTAHYADAYYRTIYPDTPLPWLIEKSRQRLGANLLSPRGWFMKISDPDTGEIMSYAKWTLPADVKARLEKEFPPVELALSELEELQRLRLLACAPNGDPLGLNAEMIVEVEERMERARESFPVGSRHMILDLLATHPTHQHRGLARAQVKWGLDLADREGLLVFLESTPAGEMLYKSLGFKEVSRATHDLEKWGGEGSYTHVFMVREPVRYGP